MEEEITEVPGAEQDVIDYTEILTSIDEKLNLLQNISTSLVWLYIIAFAIVGLFLIHLFFIGMGDNK